MSLFRFKDLQVLAAAPANEAFALTCLVLRSRITTEGDRRTSVHIQHQQHSTILQMVMTIP